MMVLQLEEQVVSHTFAFDGARRVSTSAGGMLGWVGVEAEADGKESSPAERISRNNDGPATSCSDVSEPAPSGI